MRKPVPFPTSIQFILIMLFAMASLPVHSQNPKPGIGGVLNSDDKVIWLRAEDLTLDDNVPVSLWEDRSGNSNNALQSFLSNQPVFIEDGGNLFNNHPVVSFNGNSHFMEIDNNIQLNGMDGLTILFVMKLNGTGTQAFLTKRADHNSQNRFGFLYHNNKIRFDVEAAPLESNVALNTSSSAIISSMFNGNLIGNRQFVYRNGTQVGSRTNNYTQIGTNNEPVRLGRFNEGDDRNLNGDVAEVLMYRTGLNNAQRLIVENVLAIKYGINIGANHMFSPEGYDQDIIGVGTTDGTQKHSETTGGGGGLYLSELDNGFDGINEFVFAGHDGTEHDIVSPADINTLQGVESRWNRIWRIERSIDGNAGNTPISMTFDFAEAGLTPNNEIVYVLLFKPDIADAYFGMLPSVFASVAGDSDRVTFNVPDDLFQTGYYTIAPYTDDAEEFQIKTWTSQSPGGNWNDENTWKDQNGENGTPNESLTKQFDKIIIEDSHIVTITENEYINNDLLINAGGRLVIGGTRDHFWGTIRGEGRIDIIGDYFPQGNAQQFVQAGGGTVVYYGTGAFNFTESRTFNHLTVNLTDINSSITLLADLTVNGNFHIDRGIFYINDDDDGTSRSILVRGNLRVASNTSSEKIASLLTGKANAGHFLTIRGDFTANDITRFCNLAGTSYGAVPSNGYTEVIFNHPTKDQTVQINDTTLFYRIEIDKGVDDTYQLTLKAADSKLFKLWGKNNYDQEGIPPNRTNPNALGLLAGTVVIGNHIEIERLKTGGGNYDIDQDARIIVDGGKLLAPSGSILAIVLYGNLTVENGELLANGFAGVTIREFGTFEVNGGNSNLYILRTSVISGIHRGAYIQTGGVVTIDGAGGEKDHYRFSLPYATNSYTMTGGTLNIHKPKLYNNNDISGSFGGILIGADKNNIKVTDEEGNGGTVNAYIDVNSDFIINSNAPFFNLNLIKTVSNDRKFFLEEHTGGQNVPAQNARPLEVLNNLLLKTETHGAKLDLNGYKAIIHGNFIIENNAQFIGAESHLAFVGDRDSRYEVESATSLFNVDTLSLVKDSPEQLLELNRTSTTEYVALEVNKLLSIEQGHFDYRYLKLNLKGDLFLSSSIGDEFEPGRLVLNGINLQTITIPVNNDAAFIGHLEIDNNAEGVRLQGNSIPMMQHLTLTNGVFDIQEYGISVRGNISGPFDQDRMIRTAGKHSDRGLRRLLSVDGTLVFPVGSSIGNNPVYTPLEANFSGVINEVFVQLNPVAAELSTLANEEQGKALRYYWRMRHENVAVKPTVESYVFSFVHDLLPNPIPDSLVPGKIVDFVRSHESVDNVDTVDFKLTFNKGFDLEQGEYTAADKDKFEGEVKVFYSRGNNGWSSPADWHTFATWSLTSHDVNHVPTELPGPGDIVQIGYHGASTDNNYHIVKASDNINIGGLRFHSEDDMDNPGLIIDDSSILVALGAVSGAGSFALQYGAANSIILADFGDFADQERSEFIYQSTTAGPHTMLSNVTVYPNLKFESSNDANAVFNLSNNDLLIKQNFWVTKNIEVRLSEDTEGDITISGDLKVGEVGNWGKLRFGAGGVYRNLDVSGDIIVKNSGSQIFVENVGDPIEHRIVARGNISLDNGSMLLHQDNLLANHVILELAGNTNSVFTNNGSSSNASLYQIVMNKGNNQNYQFSFDDGFSLYDDASDTFEPIILQNGLLELADQNIDVNLNPANTNDFFIPKSSGLVLRDATARVQSGISLDGFLSLKGEANLLMTGGNAYIEYGSSGNAVLEVHDSAVLSVGSQIRRNPDFTTGSIKYLQTGGTVSVGNISVPATDRGVLEILNPGSSFRFLDGELIIVRGHTGTEASLVLAPSDFLMGENAVIQLGHPTLSPSGNEVTVKSQVALPNVIVNGASNFRVKLISEPLTILGDLHIHSGTNTLDLNSLDLTLEGDFFNEGSLLHHSTSTVFFTGNSQLLSGNTSFYNMEVNVTGDLSLDDGSTKNTTDIQVWGELKLLSGIFNDNGNTIDLKGNLFNQAVHNSNTTTGGLVFSGNNLQIIEGNGSVGRVELNNPLGVKLQNSLTLEQELIFTQGKLDIQGYRLTLGANSTLFGSSFSSGRMIQMNGETSAAGVRVFLQNDKDILLPIGVSEKYTPVELQIAQNPSAGFLDVIPVNYKHVNITEPDNLNYYWTIESNNVANFTGDIVFHYRQGDVSDILDEPNYGSARLFNETWSKIGESFVDTVNNTFYFPFSSVNQLSGEYTAGANIPDVVLRFKSKVDYGAWNNPGSWENVTNDDGVPEGGPFGQIVEVMDGHTISTNSNQRIAYKSFIYGTLDLNATTNHYLGEVDGEGIVKVEGSALPVGKYNKFAEPNKGTFEYGGNSDYIIDPKYFPTVGGINSFIFSGSGKRTLPARDLLIYSDLEIRDAAQLDNTLNNTTITLMGDLIKDDGAGFRAGTGAEARLIFKSEIAQFIQGDFSGDNAFNIIEVNSPAGLTIHGATEVSTSMIMSDGLVNTSDINRLRLLNSAEVIDAGPSKYINGPLQKQGTGRFIFPVGTEERRGRIAFEPNGSLPAGTILEARYFTTTTPGFEQVEDDLERVSSLEHWQLESVGSKNIPNGKVQLYYEDISFSHITEPASLLVGRFDGNIWWNQGRNRHVSLSPTSGYIESENIDGTGLFTFATDNSNFSNNPLPVEMLSFTATVQGAEVLVEWVTASETNNNFFTVERSRDGFTFEVLGYVNGAGTVNEVRQYQLFDSEPFTGISYYRLKQTDFDGSSEYVGLVAVQIRKDVASLMQVYPNPVRNGEVNVRISNMQPDETVTIHVMDLQGRMMRSEKVYADNNGAVLHRLSQLSGLPAGLYFVVVQSRTTRITERIIIQ